MGTPEAAVSFDAVRRWRDRLRAADVAPFAGPLSSAGLSLVLADAVEALHDGALDAVAGVPGTPFATAALAVPRTVPTAPVEWCAVLLGRGTRVVLKPPAGMPGLVPLLVETARAEGLPLSAAEGHAALDGAELVVVMGEDDTVRAVRQSHPAARVLGFGHTWSIAVAHDDTSLAAVARDAMRFDGRGCLSPVAVCTPRTLDAACAVLAAAMEQAERDVPRGRITADEGAAIRTRRALARVEGVVHEADAWSVHGLPAARFAPVGLPRSIAVHALPDDAVDALLAPHAASLSTIGTDGVPPTWAHVRVCRPGDMQRPPLVRLHDGLDWIAATLRDDQADRVQR
jgi:hypothetical protein